MTGVADALLSVAAVRLELPLAKEISELQVAAIEQLGPRGYDAADVAAWRDSALAATSELDSCWSMLTARIEGRLLGYALFHEAGYLGGLYVHPSCVGRGIGSRLLCKFEATLRDRGVAAFTLDASLNSVGFYLKREYCAFGRVERLSARQRTLSAIRMMKCAE
jgi:putative acetyltransferase